MKYDAFFEKATGHAPYPFQERFAMADPLPHLLCAPTGAGKTATAVLGWLWRRFHGKNATPRRLVYCLPMRVLVEQSFAESKKWLEKLGLQNEVGIHLLMGGTEKSEWYLKPEQPAILLGTQDMLLSRALNRGYAATRFHWPIDFGYINNDCLWVFDEPQLMANGVSTSAQLAGLRATLSTAAQCTSVWMSATLEPTWLDTIDFRGKFTNDPMKLDKEDYDAKRPLRKRMTASKKLTELKLKSSKDPKEIASAIHAKHLDGTQTLAVLNTVDRAKSVYAELSKLSKKHHSLRLLLIHSRFRPEERKNLNAELCAKGEETKNRIVVATQVVEAGVDISARTLITDLCPWSSMVQRIGRCNRTGDDGPGEVYWIDLEDEKQYLPYEVKAVEFAREQAKKLDDQDVSPQSLDHFKAKEGFTLPFEHKHVLRRRDLLDVFDTTADLSGNDIDISRFVRSDDKDTDVQVYWREWSGDLPAEEEPRPVRRELCNVPIAQIKEFLDELDDRKPKQHGYLWDYLDGIWNAVDSKQVRPGMVLLLPTIAGGYSPILGWDKGSREPVPSLRPTNGEINDATDLDINSTQETPLDIRTHTDNVCKMLSELLNSIPGTPNAEELKQAARWHDAGKGHPVFQSGLRRINPNLTTDTLWAKSGCKRKLTYARKHFRHELASALVVLQQFPDWPFLTAYLVAAHHGKVRLGIRSLPGEEPPPDPECLFAQGILQGDVCPTVELGDDVQCPSTTLDLSPMQLGGEKSWTGRAMELLAQMGPFQLAYLEALLRTSDVRASRKEAGRE